MFELDYAKVLSILKYGGFALTALSTSWGLLTKPSIEEDGKKRLTRAGQMAIAIAAVSAIVSGLAYGFEAVVKNQEKVAAAEATARADDRRAAETRAAAARADAARIIEQAERRAVAAEQRALTLETTEQIRSEQQEGIRKSLYSVWKASTRVSSENIRLRVLFRCRGEPRSEKIWGYLDPSISSIIAYEKKVGGEVVQLVELTSAKGDSSDVKNDSEIVSTYSDFWADGNVDALRTLDDWGRFSIAFSTKSSTIFTDQEVKDIFGKVEDYKASGEVEEGDAQFLQLKRCRINYQLLVEGIALAEGSGIPLVVRYSDDVNVPLVAVEDVAIDADALPRFSGKVSVPTGATSLPRKANLRSPPPPPRPPSPDAR